MFLKEFKDLRRKRDKLHGLPDQINYAIPIDDSHRSDGASSSSHSVLRR